MKKRDELANPDSCMNKARPFADRLAFAIFAEAWRPERANELWPQLPQEGRDYYKSRADDMIQLGNLNAPTPPLSASLRAETLAVLRCLHNQPGRCAWCGSVPCNKPCRLASLIARLEGEGKPEHHTITIPDHGAHQWEPALASQAWGEAERERLKRAFHGLNPTAEGEFWEHEYTQWDRITREAAKIAAARQSTELREARETVARQGLRLLSFHNAESQEAAVWRGMILQDPGAKAEWESIKGDRDEFSADDAASLVAGLIEERTILRNDLARVTRERDEADEEVGKWQQLRNEARAECERLREERLAFATESEERKAECDKWRTAASVMCGEHIGKPQNECPVCRCADLVSERDTAQAECERLRWQNERLIAADDVCRSLYGDDGPEQLAAARAAGWEQGAIAAIDFIWRADDLGMTKAEVLEALRPPSQPPEPGAGEITPCPFCARQPELFSRAAAESERSDTGEMWFCKCMCGGMSARAHQFAYSRAAVLAKWNARLSTSPQPAAERGEA